jgi:hypothetical protein
MTIDKFTNAWAKTIESGGDDSARKVWKSCSVFYRGKTIYSYGEHFPMAYIIAPNLVWFNGDRFSVSTGRHQRELRASIHRHAPRAVVVIVPRTALEAAGLDYKTIQPLDVHGERWQFTLQTSMTPPSDMIPKVSRFASYGENYSYERAENVVGYVNRDGSLQEVRFIDGLYHWHNARHWLGDSVFTALKRVWTVDGTHTERLPFISSFDKQERVPLYFLSQLPYEVGSYDEAIEALAPESVKTARECGRQVVRQGDMFAIPMNVTTRQLKAMGATMQKRQVTLQWHDYALNDLAKIRAIDTVRKTMPDKPRNSWDTGWREWELELERRVCAKYPELWPNGPTGNHWRWRPSRPNPRWAAVRRVSGGALYGTAHTATEVATLPDGRQYARGVMYHEPAVIGERRERDHARRPLGKQWHLVARNTVPVQGQGTGRRAA